MKTIQKLLITVLTLSVIGFLPPASAVVLEFIPSTTTFSTGDTVTVDVQVADLGTEIVSAYDLDFLYDSTILSATDVLFDIYLGDGIFSFQTFDLLQIDLVNFYEVSLLSDADLADLQSTLGGVVSLATLEFTALLDGDESAFLGFSFDRVGADVKCSNNQVCIPVPEPSVVTLFLFGLVVTGASRWANMKSST